MGLRNWLWKGREVPAGWADRLDRVEETQAQCNKNVKALKVEWEDVYDRIARILDRLNARSKAEAKKEREQEAPAEAAPSDADLNRAILEGTFPYLNGRRIA